MFHVSTLIPYVPDDEQQIERKRHIGNDIVMIVFKEGTQPFDPQVMRSKFNRTNDTVHIIFLKLLSFS